MSATESFRVAMRAIGLHYDGPILADGELHRFKAADDKARNSWYVFHAGPPAVGVYGCWKRGTKEKWCEREGQQSRAEMGKIRERWKLAEAEHERDEKERQKKARQTAEWIFSRSRPADGHAYLERKGVKSFGSLRQSRGALVVPLCDDQGAIHSVQFISVEGSKRFLKGGRVDDCLFTVSNKPDGPLIICEGYATGASVHEATGFATACAMNSGNLLTVAKSSRAKWPDREIIIVADNDQWTDGNPGVIKATKAARSIQAKLAVPRFTNTTSRPTDYNDLHQLEGVKMVNQQITDAILIEETEEETFQRLAELSATEYDRCYKDEAKRLGIRTSTLDDEVNARRLQKTDPQLQGGDCDMGNVEPWLFPVCGSEMLNQISETFSRYVVLPDGAADAIALWCGHAHAFESFTHTPRLNISSPEKGCGKTTLRDVISLFVPRPLLTENLTVAVLFRLIEAHKPTILADEYDSWLNDNEELRGLLNAGHRRGGAAYRCEGDKHEVRKFSVFAPAVLVGIGSLPGTLYDRSILIRLERSKPGELRQRFDSRRTECERELLRKLAKWCSDNSSRLAECDPQLPEPAFNRLADNWRPLFAIAEIAGGDWPKRAAAAYAKLTGGDDLDAQGIRVMLLTDIRQVFIESLGIDRIYSSVLVEKLCAMSDRPWPEARNGKEITETWLARKLQQFKIRSKKLRIPGGQPKQGYYLSDIADIFTRYLPTVETKWNNGTTIENIVDSNDSEAEQPKAVFQMENAIPANEDEHCSSVPLPPVTPNPQGKKMVEEVF